MPAVVDAASDLLDDAGTATSVEDLSGAKDTTPPEGGTLITSVTSAYA
jgi:hypothetical protein